MENQSMLSWTDIKKYEEILAKDPDSYCFTLLAYSYLKLGLIDDAINVATRGIQRHHQYIGGYLVAGVTYFEKGMKEECKKALEHVAMVTPDNLQAQKLLSRIYIDEGDTVSAIKSLQIIQLFHPDDEESISTLERLQNVTAVAESVNGQPVPVVSGFEKTYADEMETGQPDNTDLFGAGYPEKATTVSSEEAPLVTVTLAELYASQGFIDRAIAVYRQLLAHDVDNEGFKARLEDLEKTASGINAEEAKAANENIHSRPELHNLDSSQSCAKAAVHAHGQDEIVSILESWLGNVRRGRNAA